MNRALVRLLLWFFIAALPVQGFAAAVRTCCGPAQWGGAAGPAQSADMALGQGTAATMGHGQHGGMPMTIDVDAHAARQAPSQHCADMALQAPQAQSTEPHTQTDTADSAAVVNPAHASSLSHNVHDAHDAGACSACAACCYAAVSTMPTVLKVMPVFSSAVKIALAPAALLPGHIPGGLERPPRHSFA